MVEIKDSKYLKIGYFQKSKILFAIIAVQKYYKDKLINTYLFSPHLDESILDYYLFVEFKEDVVLDEDLERYLYCSYNTEDDTKLYIFDMTDFKDDIDKFLLGSYSEFSEQSKDKILHYFGYYSKDSRGKIIKCNVHALNGMLHYYTFLYPDKCKEQIANDMNNSLFASKGEALMILKGMKEICLPYDMEKETINKNLSI